MINVTQDKAKVEFKKTFPSRTIHWITHHGNHWYVMATDPTDPEEGEMNPFFTVDDNTGELGEFYVIKDLELFNTLINQVKASLK